MARWSVPAAPFQVFTWGEGLMDPTVAAWMESIGGMVELLVPVDDPRPEAFAEFFICPTRGWTIHALIKEAERRGLVVLLNIDPHHGNGRREAQSAVGWGPYHRDHGHGGYNDAVSRVLSWVDRYPNVVGIQLGNEWTNRPWMAEWYEERCEQNVGRIRARGLVAVGGGGLHDGSGLIVEVSARHCDYLDPHVLFDLPVDSLELMRFLMDSYVRNPAYTARGIWITEEAEREPALTAEIMAQLRDAGAEALACFTGHTLHGDFTGGRHWWNWKTYNPTFVAWESEGIGIIGQEVGEFWSAEPPAPPPPPPDDDEEDYVRDLTDEQRRELAYRLARAFRRWESLPGSPAQQREDETFQAMADELRDALLFPSE